MILGNLRAGVRSFRDVNAFCLRVLRPQSVPLVLVSTCGFAGGLVYLGVDIRSGAWIAVAVGAFGALDTIFSLAQRFSSPRKRVCPDERTSALLSKLTVRDDHAADGYGVTFVPGFTDEAVVRSSAIDARLREPGTDFPLEVNEELRGQLDTKLQSHAQPFEDVIRLHYRRSRRSDPPKHFFNDAKVCLGGDLLRHTDTVEIYQGSYFHSFVTNELVTRSLWDEGVARPQPLYRGSEQFPAIVQRDGTVTLKRLPDAHMGNHIGISTVVHTSDKQLLLWRQAPAAQQNEGQLVPTGSGSSDWGDWLAQPAGASLKGLVTYAMAREFREESLNKLQPRAGAEAPTIETRVLGHFLWMRRGGKPEFVGLSRITWPSARSHPDAAEVEQPANLEPYPANTVSVMQRSIERILTGSGPYTAAVPLWVALTCLQEALTADPEGWAAFLEIDV